MEAPTREGRGCPLEMEMANEAPRRRLPTVEREPTNERVTMIHNPTLELGFSRDTCLDLLEIQETNDENVGGVCGEFASRPDVTNHPVQSREWLGPSNVNKTLFEDVEQYVASRTPHRQVNVDRQTVADTIGMMGRYRALQSNVQKVRADRQIFPRSTEQLERAVRHQVIGDTETQCQQ
eukprot:c47214_g1_i1 orf=12-548(-)